MCRSSESLNDHLPYYGELFRSIYKAIPQYELPYLKLSMSFAMLSTIIFVILRIITTTIMISEFGWPDHDPVTTTASSSIPSMIHATLLCPGLIAAFMAHKYNPSEHLSKANPKWQDLCNALLEFCTGYMINDTFFLVYYSIPPGSLWPIMNKSNKGFLFHHLLTILYMSQARYYKAGHMSAMMCMLLGELSNPLMNTFGMVKYASGLECFKDGPMLQQAKEIVPVLYSLVFLFLRTIIGPIVLIAMTGDLLFSKQGKENLPFHVRIMWSLIIWGVMSLSIPLISDCKDMIMAFARGQEQEL